MRNLSLLALLFLMVFLSGCSFSTDLAVINLTDQAIEVRYRIKYSPGPFSPPIRPATKTSAELDDDSPWHDLQADQFVVGPHNRTITVIVPPHTALLVDRVRGPGVPADVHFSINEIVVRGAYGTMMLHGEQVRKGFAQESESKQVYSITYK